MEIKKLPARVIEFLSPLENLLSEEQLIIPTENTDDLREIAKGLWLQKIKPYYSKFKIDANNGIFNFLLEPLKNANYHGSPTKDNPIRLCIFLTPQALVTSYCDNGTYFTRQDVKEAYERKIPHPEKHRIKRKDIGGGAGTYLLYTHSDFIHIDTKTGKLFTGISTKSIFFNHP